MTDEARRRFADAKIPVKHETSFQGGDGYMYFGNRALTTRALATVVMDGEIPRAENDPFYSEAEFQPRFLPAARAFQQNALCARRLPGGARRFRPEPVVQDGFAAREAAGRAHLRSRQSRAHARHSE